MRRITWNSSSNKANVYLFDGNNKLPIHYAKDVGDREGEDGNRHEIKALYTANVRFCGMSLLIASIASIASIRCLYCLYTPLLSNFLPPPSLPIVSLPGLI